MRAVRRSWGHSSCPRACTARRNLVHLCPDDLGSPCPWDAHSPACETFRQEGAHAGRCCLCGYLICLPLFRLLLSSVGTAFGRAERPIVAVLPRGLSRRAVRRGVGLRGALRLPALPHTALVFLEILPHQSGDHQRQRHRVAVLRIRRRRRGLQVGMEVRIEPARDRHRRDGDGWPRGAAVRPRCAQQGAGASRPRWLPGAGHRAAPSTAARACCRAARRSTWLPPGAVPPQRARL